MVSVLGATIAVIAIIALTLTSLAGSANGMLGSATSGATSIDANAAGGKAGVLVRFVQALGSGTFGAIFSAVSNLAGIAVVALLSILLTYYFMRDGPTYWRGFLKRVEPGRRSHIEAAGQRAFNVLGGYMVGTGAISIFGAATQQISDSSSPARWRARISDSPMSR